MGRMSSPELLADPEWTTGDRIRKARHLAGLDQIDLAKRLGCSRNTVARWEQGRITPKTATLLAVASITGVNPEWLTDAGVKR